MTPVRTRSTLDLCGMLGEGPSQEMGALLLRGWTLLDQVCADCGVVPLMQKGTDKICVDCSKQSSKAGVNPKKAEKKSAAQQLEPADGDRVYEIALGNLFDYLCKDISFGETFILLMSHYAYKPDYLAAVDRAVCSALSAGPDVANRLVPVLLKIRLAMLGGE